MVAIVILLALLALIALSAFKGRDSRVLDDARGWWPAYRRDQAENR